MAVEEMNFDVGGVHVRADIKTIPLFQRNTLQNDFASVYWENATNRQGLSPNIAHARNLIFRAALTYVEIGGTARIVDPQEPLKNLDFEESDEYMDNIEDELLKRICYKNSFLHQKDPFWPFFQGFAPKVTEAGENPTEGRTKTGGGRGRVVDMDTSVSTNSSKKEENSILPVN